MSTIDPTARIEDGAVIGKGTSIGPYCVIGPDVVIGAYITRLRRVVHDKQALSRRARHLRLQAFSFVLRKQGGHLRQPRRRLLPQQSQHFGSPWQAAQARDLRSSRRGDDLQRARYSPRAKSQHLAGEP